MKWFPRLSVFALTLILLLTLSGLASAQTCGTAPCVQVNSNPGPATPQQVVNVDYLAAETATDLNVVVVGWSDSTSTITSVTDTQGNTYRVAAGTTTEFGSSPVSQEIFYAVVGVAPPATNTVTVNFSQKASAPDVRIVEYIGAAAISPLDASAGGFGHSNSADSTAATTRGAIDLIVGGGTTTTSFNAAGTGFTARILNNSPYDDIVEDKNVALAGSYNATASLATGNWVMQVVAFSATGLVSAAPTLAATPVAPATGGDVGGDSVTITGTNFLPGTVALFGVAPGGVSLVNCTVPSATEMDCTTPTHASGKVDLTVINPDGQAASVAEAFTYAVTTPSITSITPGTDISNGGVPFTIVGTNFQNGASVTFDGIPASALAVSSDTKITGDAPAHPTGSAQVKVQNPDSGKATTSFTYSKGTGAINFVQSALSPRTTSAQGTISATMISAQTAGNFNVVIVGWGDATASVSSVTDTAGNTYTLAAFTGNPKTNGSDLSQAIYYAANIAASGPGNVITATFNGSAQFPDLRTAEYSGVDTTNPLDTGTAAIGNNSPADSGGINTKFTNEVVVGAGATNQAFTDAGTGFSMVGIDGNSNLIEHDVTTTVSNALHAVGPINKNGHWIMQAVAFKAAGAGGGDFSLSASPTSDSVAPGGTATSTISINPTGGFSGTVSLACSGINASQGMSCTLSPASITPGTTSTLTVTTTAASAMLTPQNKKNLFPLYALWLPMPGLALAGFGLASSNNRKRKLGLFLLCGLLLAMLALQLGCGGGGSSSGGGGGGTSGTPAGTYTVAITGTSGSLSHQTAFTVTVQ